MRLVILLAATARYLLYDPPLVVLTWRARLIVSVVETVMAYTHLGRPSAPASNLLRRAERLTSRFLDNSRYW